MKSGNLDNLPLLASFRAIAEEGSVVAAADRLGVTQSAVSKHLARLREWLDDPLFVRTSAGMVPTPRAVEIAATVEDILSGVDALAERPAPDPATFLGTFTLSSTDEVLWTILPGLLQRLADEAPEMRLTAIPLSPDYSLHSLETGTVNLLIGVNWHAPEVLRQTRLMQDRFVVVMRRDNPLAGTTLTPGSYAGARHLLVAPLGMSTGAIDPFLVEHGLARRIVASVPNFTLVTAALLGNDRVVTLPERVAQRLSRRNADILVTDLPVASPPIVYHALWHPRFDREPRLRWMRTLVADELSAPTGR